MSPGLVNFVTAVVYHFCQALPAAFTQPGDSLFAQPCIPPSLPFHLLTLRTLSLSRNLYFSNSDYSYLTDMYVLGRNLIFVHGLVKLVPSVARLLCTKTLVLIDYVLQTLIVGPVIINLKIWIHDSAKRHTQGCVNAAGYARQKWYATAGTKATKPLDHLLAESTGSALF